MASYNLTVTNAGNTALASALANGWALNITSVQFGSGQIGTNNPEAQTQLVNPQAYGTLVAENTLVQYQTSIEFTLSTTQVTYSFSMYEIGVWASLNGGAPLLFCYGWTTTPDTITPGGSTSAETYDFQLGIKYNQAATVSVTLSLSMSVPLHAATHIPGASGANGGIDPLPTAGAGYGIVPPSPNDANQTLIGTQPVSWGRFMPSGLGPLPYAGSSAPSGWLLCDGSSYSTSSYPGLFAVIGYQFGGAGNTFRVPNMVGNVPVGAGTGYSLGSTGGAAQTNIRTNQLPPHDHPVIDDGHDHPVSDGGHAHEYGFPSDDTPGSVAYNVNAGNVNIVQTTQTTSTSRTGISIQSAVTGISIGDTGGGEAVSLMQPYLALNFIIKT
jgi:microcystin-dependent protein